MCRYKHFLHHHHLLTNYRLLLIVLSLILEKTKYLQFKYVDDIPGQKMNELIEAR